MQSGARYFWYAQRNLKKKMNILLDMLIFCIQEHLICGYARNQQDLQKLACLSE